MKSYTDILQSKKLADILPIESADMCWELDKNCSIEAYNLVPLIRYSTKERKELFANKDNIPAWSLSALLQLLPHNDMYGIEFNNYSKEGKNVWTMIGHYGFPYIRISNNLVDLCIEIIIKLKEDKLI